MNIICIPGANIKSKLYPQHNTAHTNFTFSAGTADTIMYTLKNIICIPGANIKS